jgi:predicted ATPase
LYAEEPCDNAGVLGKNEGFIREVRLLRDHVDDFEKYPYSIPAIRTLEVLKLDPRVTILAGENGSGKSTLIEAIAVLAGFRWALPHSMSHGESFLYTVAERFGPRGLFIMDEPESALSPMRQLALLRLIRDRVATGSQFVIATHSPVLMACPGASIYWLDQQGMRRRDLEEIEHFTVLRAFLNAPERMLETLLAKDETP